MIDTHTPETFTVENSEFQIVIDKSDVKGDFTRDRANKFAQRLARTYHDTFWVVPGNGSAPTAFRPIPSTKIR